MAKNKKKEDTEEIIEDEYIYGNEEETFDNEDGEEIIDSSLEIGGQIHIQSPIVKKFVQLPKDVKYSKFNNIDLANFTLKSKTYMLWNYLKKIQYISKDELTKIRDNRKEIYDIKTLLDFKTHLEDNKKGHIWYNLIQEYTPEELKTKFELLKNQLIIAKEDGALESIYGDKTNFYSAYDSYLENDTSSPEVDDFGLMGGMMTITEIKKAHQGWGTKMMNTTINVTKDEDIDEDTEETPEKKEGFLSKLKK